MQMMRQKNAVTKEKRMKKNKQNIAVNYSDWFVDAFGGTGTRTRRKKK